MLRILALALLLLSACAGSAPSLDSEETAPLVVAIEEAPQGAPSCVVTFTPDPELAAETRAAAERWSLATGCDIRVGEGGIAVRLVEDRMITPSGTEAHGRTYCPAAPEKSCARSGLVIEVARDHDPATVPHEMGHALAATSGHVEEESALMFHTGGEGAILSADLVYVCDALDCTVMQPEG